MLSGLTEEEGKAVDEGMLIHTLETAEDSFVSLKMPENEARILDLIREFEPTGVVYDVLRDFGNRRPEQRRRNDRHAFRNWARYPPR